LNDADFKIVYDNQGNKREVLVDQALDWLNDGCIFQLEENTYMLKHVGGHAIVDRFK